MAKFCLKSFLLLSFIGSPVVHAREILKTSSTPKGFFISIDGLRFDHLSTMVDSGLLTAPKGLAWLYKNSYASAARPVVTTLTASSHISIATCSTPATHGIIANSFLKDNEVRDGYSYPIAAETFWQAAQRQGRKVISLAYVGVDGKSEARSVDYGVSYPSLDLQGAPQDLRWNFADLTSATDWQLLAGMEAVHKQQATTEIILNVSTGEKISLYFLFDTKIPAETKIYIDNDKNLANGFLQLINSNQTQKSASMFIHETNSQSRTFGYKRRVDVLLRGLTEYSLNLYVAPATYTQAFPASFRRFLDDHDLVWPPTLPEKSYYTAVEIVKNKSNIDQFLTDVAKITTEQFGYDIIAFYQPLIDSTGHKYEADLPLPFNPHATDAISQGYVQAFQIIDQNIHSLLLGAHDEDVIMLVGDHGMAPMKKYVNIAPIFPEIVTQARTVKSGSLFLVYGGPEKSNGDEMGLELVKRLQELKHGDERIFDHALRKKDYPKDKNLVWQFGEADWVIYTLPGFWLTVDTQNSQVFLPSPAGGMHGFDPKHTVMDTAFLLHSNAVTPVLNKMAAPVDLMNAVPTFAKLLNLESPKDCEGMPLF